MKKALAFFPLLVLPLFAGEHQIPAEGTPAPSFTLPNQDGSPVALDQLRGKWVVLYFYPKDFTSGCIEEARNFQHDIDKYSARRATVVGVSLDSVESHKGFGEQEGIKFTLLSDTKHKVTQMYGSLSDYHGMPYSARNTFLIDPAGTIRKVYFMVNPSDHSDQVLADLDSLQAAH